MFMSRNFIAGNLLAGIFWHIMSLLEPFMPDTFRTDTIYCLITMFESKVYNYHTNKLPSILICYMCIRLFVPKKKECILLIKNYNNTVTTSSCHTRILPSTQVITNSWKIKQMVLIYATQPRWPNQFNSTQDFARTLDYSGT